MTEPKAVRTRSIAGNLWMVQAVIQPFRLDAVTLALEEIPGFGGMTVVECRGFGREKVRGAGTVTSEGREREHSAHREPGLVDFTTKLLIEVAVAGESHAEAVAAAIAQAAHTGRRGDGKIFLWPLGRVVGVRTLDENESAL